MHEADIALMYAVITRGLLEVKGINTVLLTYQTYSQRHAFCRSVKANVHFQCHLNSQNGKYGLILYRESNAENSLPLALKIADQFQKNLPISLCKLEAMGEKDSRNGCIMDGIPSLILEPLFLDNQTHYEFLNSDNGLVVIAESITQAIMEWRTM
jgi:N-acetylmuramoyl-L-alanine amidase